jgi:DHA1 family tetracycline resistance protein-like MFS transporter
MGALFGLGFIVGPLVGGLLVSKEINLMFIFGGILALVDTLGLLFFLKETHPGDHEVKLHRFSLKTVYKVMSIPKYTYTLLSFLLLITAVNVYQSVLSLYMNAKFAREGKQI